jgi:pyruvate dehydrogenase E2 component (dihydrolipoamide acetyltransferase)
MKVPLKMPDLSTASTGVKILAWLVRAGQKIRRGQPILEVETDKASMEVEGYLNGTLAEIIAPAGSDVEVGQVIAMIETVEEIQLQPGGEVKAEASAVSPESQALPVGSEARPRGMFSRNRQKAMESVTLGIPPASLSPNQQVVGKRMLESKQTIPHFYLQTSANANSILERRSAALADKPVLDAFFACAAGKALRKFERMNGGIEGGRLVSHTEEVIGIAVDVDGDLFVIPIHRPSTKSPEAVSGEIRLWVSRLRSGDPEARKIHPASFTLSNLGSTGIESFTAIINPPESAVLAIGKIRPVVSAVDGQVVIEQRVNLTLSVDHRLVNGHYAAEFLEDIARQLESI